MRHGIVAALCLAVGVVSLSVATAQNEKYFAPQFHDHVMTRELDTYMERVIDAGRVQVFQMRSDVSYEEIPQKLQDFVKVIDIKVALPDLFDAQKHFENTRMQILDQEADPEIVKVISGVTEDSLGQRIQEVISFGSRSTEDSLDYFMQKFKEYGYEPIHDFNIEAWKQGTEKPDEIIIVEGHMDTVSGTVGADDNASGAAAVLEVARVLSKVETKRSILFLVTEDEEIGLVGAKAMVKKLRNEGKLEQVKFVTNMDMIGYNQNGIVDLESEPEFEDLVDWVSEQVLLYTDLQPNKVLNAWGSDHVPFINAGVPALLTIEHWKTHTPCYHRACDTFETLNMNYAMQIARLNAATVILKANEGLD